MIKRVKKCLCIGLIVLLITMLLPVQVSAKPGTYHPDIEIYFYPVWTNDYFDYGKMVSKPGRKVHPHVTEGPGDPTLDYNPTTGKLKYTKAKFAPLFKYYGMNLNKYFPNGDRTLKKGDYFAATVVCKNISTLFALQAAIQYSSNLSPAGITVTSAGKGRKKVETATLTTAKNASVFYGYYDAISASSYYDVDTEGNELKSNRTMFIGCAGHSPYVNVSKVSAKDAKLFTNPSSGKLGYNFSNTPILATYIFKITGDGPISFKAADPNNKIYGGFGGGFYVANSKETRIEQYTTLAKQSGAPGSRKMTFFGNWKSKSAVKTPSLKKVKAGRKLAKVYWSKVSGGTAYQIQYSTNASFKGAKIKKAARSKSALTIKKLKKGKRYYFRIRTVKGKKHSSWSAAKSIKVK